MAQRWQWVRVGRRLSDRRHGDLGVGDREIRALPLQGSGAFH